jgi:hypothetical protein
MGCNLLSRSPARWDEKLGTHFTNFFPLEIELQGELHHSWISGQSVIRPLVPGPESITVRQAEQWRVEQIKLRSQKHPALEESKSLA